MEDITKETKKLNQIADLKESVKENDFVIKGGKKLFAKGNQLAKGRRKQKPFSLKEDLLKSLKDLKKRDKKAYWKLISSYWQDPKMRSFLMEQIDGKARQSMEIGGTQANPIRIIEISQISPDLPHIEPLEQ